MKLSDCEGVFWKEAAMCHRAFYDQQATRLREHAREVISNLGDDADDACDPVSLGAAFSKREASWESYSESECDVTCHCDGLACGSGHSSCFHGCAAENAQERVEFLRRELMEGLEVWGCTVPLLLGTKTLRTPSFEVTLKAKCKAGFFDCENIEFQARDPRTGKDLHLDGTRVRECDLDACRWRGYTFEGEGFAYRIGESGLLSLQRVGDSAPMVEEQGSWE